MGHGLFRLTESHFLHVLVEVTVEDTVLECPLMPFLRVDGTDLKHLFKSRDWNVYVFLKSGDNPDESSWCSKRIIKLTEIWFLPCAKCKRKV